MDSIVFTNEIDRLKLFYPALKPKNETLKAWFDELKAFSNKAFSDAVTQTINTLEKAPSFVQLKNFTRVEEAKKRDTKGFRVLESAGAPLTPEKQNLAKECLTQLRIALENKTVKNPDVVRDLKNIWSNCYKNLPGYKGSYEVSRLVQSGAFDKLHDLGLIEGGYAVGQGSIGFLGRC